MADLKQSVIMAAIVASLYLLYFIYDHSYFKHQNSVKIAGKIDEIWTSVEDLNEVNTKINPILNVLKKSKFFRIFKVNLENECPFWDAEGTWFTSKWSVGEWENDEVPDEWRQCEHTYDVERNLQRNEVSMIDSFLPNTQINEWMKNEEEDQHAIFVNLDKNLESMTYFNGSHIWDAIYHENCLSYRKKNQCKEDHILYKLISGVHANVNMHISHFDHDENGAELPPNYERYFKNVGSHQERISNMYYTYSFVLKAVNHLSGKVDGFSYLSDNPRVNQQVKEQLNSLIDISIKTWEEPFQENNMLELTSKEQFISNIKPVFYNITRILDCVTCEKWRLHGKLQFTGLTAVMKIMFGRGNEAKLTRNEMVGLINLMAKLSNSLKWYQEWMEKEYERKMLKTYAYYAIYINVILIDIVLILHFFIKSDAPLKPNGKVHPGGGAQTTSKLKKNN